MYAIFKREIKAYFVTPIGWIYMGLFLLITGFFFTVWHLLSGSSDFSRFLGSMLFIYLLAIPILTMRLFSEEKKQRTDQLLLTSPISIQAIVFGKFLAALALYSATVIITFFYSFIIAAYGDMRWGETIGSYIGFIFLGASYISIGVFISVVTENQVIAAIVTFFCLLFVLFMEPIAQIVPADLKAGVISASVLAVLVLLFIFLNTRNWVITLAAFALCAAAIVIFFFAKDDVFLGFIRKFLGWFSLNGRYQDFVKGILKIDTLVYYCSFCALFMFMTVRVIEKRRWN